MSDIVRIFLPLFIMTACAVAMLSDIRKANRRSRIRDSRREVKP